jgi:RimJ/RimL family protein N-acetyltransferase
MAPGRYLPQVITTDRLVLRPFELSDVDDVLAYATDPQWALYLPVPQPYLREHAEQFIAEQVLKDWGRNPTWALTLQGSVCGAVDLSIEGHKVSMGWALARSLWSQGYVTEAARQVIELIWETHPGVIRIYAFCDARNVASRRVMKKLDLTYEGTLCKHLVHREEPIDVAYFGRCREQ